MRKEKFKNWTLPTIMSVGFVIGLIVGARCAGFWSNLVAELTGMCLSIAVGLVWVDRVARRIEEGNRIAQNKRLHDSLSHLLGFLVEATKGNYLHWSKHALYSEPLAAKIVILREIVSAIVAQSYRMNMLQEKSVIESSHESLDAVRALSSVAFHLSGRHGLLWLAISKSVAQLAKLYPFAPAVVSTEARLIVVGQDEFSLNFFELVEHMLMFEQATNETRQG